MKLTPIRLRRLNMGIERDEAIKALNITKSTFYKLEQGWVTPSLKLIKRLASLYQCSIDEIFKELKIEE